jgi:sugar lactone lactonase YvrE
MNITRPALGIRFDIDKVDSADYGTACWKVFWRAVDTARLAGATLYEGDSAATLGGRENVYCLALQTIDGANLSAIRAALESDPGYLQVAAQPKFIEVAALAREPLPEAGQVDASGALSGGYNARYALEAVRRARQEVTAAPNSVTQKSEGNGEAGGVTGSKPADPEPVPTPDDAGVQQSAILALGSLDDPNAAPPPVPAEMSPSVEATSASLTGLAPVETSGPSSDVQRVGTTLPAYTRPTYTPPASISPLAIASLATGIGTWFILPLVGAIAAVVTGHLAKKQIRRNPERLTGTGLATAGLVLGYAQLGVVLLIAIMAGIMTIAARPDTQLPGNTTATLAPAFVDPTSTDAQPATNGNASISLAFAASNPIVALAAGSDDTLYAVTTQRDVLRISPDGKSETLQVNQQGCGFSSSGVAILGDSVVTNDCVDNKDVLIRIDPDGRKTTLTTLAENLTALASDPGGQLYVGTWTSEGDLSMNFQPTTYLGGAEDIRGHVSVLGADGRSERVYEGGIPLALVSEEQGALAAAIWGQAGRFAPEASTFSMCGPAKHLWIALSDQARLQTVGPVASDAIPTGGWPGAFTLITSAPNNVVFAFGNLPDEPCGIYRFEPGQAPQRLAFDSDLAKNVTALSASTSALYFADIDGKIHKAGLDFPGVAVSEARPLPAPTATIVTAAVPPPTEPPPTATPSPPPTATATPTLSLTAGPISLAEALDQSLADIQILGKGSASGNSVIVVARRIGDNFPTITVAPGTVLVNAAAGEQNMVVRRLLGWRVDEQSYRPADAITLFGIGDAQTYAVEAYCLNLHKENPSSGASFTLGSVAEPAVIAILGAADRVPGANADIMAIQAAIWAVTDDPTWPELEDRGYSPDHERVRALLQEAGLDPTCMALFGGSCTSTPPASSAQADVVAPSSRAAQPISTPPAKTTILDAQVQKFFAPGPNSGAIAVTGDAIWVADGTQRRIHHLDRNGAPVGSFQVKAEGEFRGLAWDGEALWLLVSDYSKGNRVLRLDTQGNVLSSVGMPVELKSLSWDPVDQTFWAIPSQANGFLLELNADGSLQRTLPMPVFGGAQAVVWAPDGLWVLNVFGTWHRFTFDGAYLASAKLPVEVFAGNPALAWDPQGYLWLSVPGAREIHRFSLREAVVEAELPPEMRSTSQQRTEGQFPLPPVVFRPAAGSTNALAQVVNSLPATLAVALDSDQGGQVHESGVLAPGETWSAIVPQGGVFTLFLTANAAPPVAYSDKVLLLPGYEYTWTVGNAVAANPGAPAGHGSDTATPMPTATEAPSPTATSSPPAVTVAPTLSPTRAAPTRAPTRPRPTSAPSAACADPRLRIIYPANGATISGVTNFIGTANLPDQTYYKFEYKPADGSTWQFLTQFDGKAVVNDKLMDFFTTTIAPGVYDFRLIAVDRSGNYPPPCELRVTVQR